MLDSNDIREIKKTVEEFFQKTTIPAEAEVKLTSSPKKGASQILEEDAVSEKAAKDADTDVDTIVIDAKIETPEILIGEGGHTLLEIQRLLRIILNKKLDKNFYIDLDINDYKKKKIEYLKDLAKDLADEVILTKEEKVLLPMSAYERRIIHMELANRSDIITESQGEEPDRKVIIKPR